MTTTIEAIEEHVVAPTPIISVSPVVLPAPGRAVNLHVKVTAPVTGEDLPIILLYTAKGVPTTCPR